MVYTGKPSRACATCKKRRIKCDEARPACGQCVKSKRECTGYKSEAELMFRDETTATAQRAERARKSKSTSPPKDHPEQGSSAEHEVRVMELEEGMILVPNVPDEDDINTDIVARAARYFSFDSSPTPNAMTMFKPITPSYLDIAKAYFFHEFVMPKSNHNFNHLHLVESMHRSAQPCDAISKTTDALSLLSLSRQPAQRFLQPEAARAYGMAVHTVAKAIADPVKIRDNATLMSVGLLSLAETLDISASQYASPPPSWKFNEPVKERGIAHFHQAWGAHAQGAQSIIRLRGVKDMCSSPVGFPLLVQTRFQMIVRNIFSCEPIEEQQEVWEPDVESRALMKPFKAQIDLAGIGLRIPTLRFRALNLCRRPMAPGMGDALNQLLSDIRDLEIELINWSFSARNIRRETVAGYYHGSPVEGTSIEDEKALPGHVFTYDNILSMNAWNFYRVYRIFNQMMIFNVLERLIPNELHDTHSDFIACRETIIALAKDCCASVPYGMGQLGLIPLTLTPPSKTGNSLTPTFVDPALLPSQTYPLDIIPTFTSVPSQDATIAVAPADTNLFEHFDPNEVSFEAFDESFVEDADTAQATSPNANAHQEGSSASNSPHSPQSAQTSSPNSNSPPRRPTARGKPPSDTPDIHGPVIWAWYLIWPIHIAQCPIAVPKYIKDFIRGRFRYIGETYGIAQASVYTNRVYDEYVPGRVRTKVMPFDFAPPAWEPLQ